MRRELLTLGLAVLLSGAAWARPAAADCTTDLDCPGPTCGSAVCQWSVGGHACVAAGTDPQGFDGFCTADSDCKCRVQGATCLAGVSHCSFTLPEDAGSTGPASDAGASGATTTGTTPGCAVTGPGGAPAGSTIALVCAAGLALARRRRR